MKGWGIALIVLGILNIIRAVLAVTNGAASSGVGIAFIILGAYLIHMAKQKENEKQDSDNWSNS